MLTFGSLFSGIGGLDLGLERAGWSCSWQVEIDGFCNAILERHWPRVQRLRDVRFAGDTTLPRVDLIAGGFPCQGVSVAGKRRGLADHRTGLWWEFRRVVAELRPRLVLVENVPGLLNNGLADVLGSLAALGYDAEWDVVPASAVGAPHLRERLFVVAHAISDGVWDLSERHQWQGRCERAPERGNAVPLHDGANEQVAHGHGLALGACFGGDTPAQLEVAARASWKEGGHGNALNPEWVELLMGFPMEWTRSNLGSEACRVLWGEYEARRDTKTSSVSRPSAMPSSPRSPSSSVDG